MGGNLSFNLDSGKWNQYSPSEDKAKLEPGLLYPVLIWMIELLKTTKLFNNMILYFLEEHNNKESVWPKKV